MGPTRYPRPCVPLTHGWLRRSLLKDYATVCNSHNPKATAKPNAAFLGETTRNIITPLSSAPSIPLVSWLTPKATDVSEYLSDFKGVDLRDLLQRVFFLC